MAARMHALIFALVVAFIAATPASASHCAMLVEVRRGSNAGEQLLRNAGARLVAPQLRLWRVPADRRASLLPQLVRAHALVEAEPEQLSRPLAAPLYSDPLYNTEWWRSAIGADGATPPGPGVPVTVLDSGIDLSHPEFAHRTNTRALNAQSLGDTPEDFHGTAVASVAAAPANDAGIVGVYPAAALQSWDARALSNADVIAGILAAAKHGPTVINLSLGYPQFDPMLEQAVLIAFGEGSLVVAAAGNDYENGNPLIYPASFPHVLTVAATDEENRPTFFSSASEAVDLAAPGEDIVAAVPTSFDANGWRRVDGTSFSAPIVSAATAWVWTVRRRLDNTQIFELIRTSAHDISRTGFDPDTGFGLLDLPAALAAVAPAPDPQEPNDDIDEIKANGLFRTATAPLTRSRRSSARIAARLDITEDPRDVYRVWVPAHRSVHARLSGSNDVDLELWKPTTTSVEETGAAMRRDLIAGSEESGAALATARNNGRHGEYVYVDVFPGPGTATASYTLSVSSRP